MSLLVWISALGCPDVHTSRNCNVPGWASVGEIFCCVWPPPPLSFCFLRCPFNNSVDIGFTMAVCGKMFLGSCTVGHWHKGAAKLTQHMVRDFIHSDCLESWHYCEVAKQPAKTPGSHHARLLFYIKETEKDTLVLTYLKLLALFVSWWMGMLLFS